MYFAFLSPDGPFSVCSTLYICNFHTMNVGTSEVEYTLTLFVNVWMKKRKTYVLPNAFWYTLCAPMIFHLLLISVRKRLLFSSK